MEITKRCTKCSEEKTHNLFSKNKCEKDGLQSKCKQCVKDYNNKNKEHIKIKCSVYYAKNKEKIISKVKEYTDKNAEIIKQRKKRHYEKNKQEVIANTRLWAEKNREKSNQIKKDYKIRNPHKNNLHQAKRRAQKRLAVPKWLTLEQQAEIDKIYQQAKNLSDKTGSLYEVDHIIPLQGKNVSGLHVSWNLQIIPRAANRSKSNKV